MNIRDLEYLVSLADFKHFRKAADACNVSQPTLSGQIRKLEDELGTILLERTSRKVLFTQSGLALVDQAKTILREVKVLKEMASNQGQEMSGPIHIGIIPTLGAYLSPLFLPTLKEKYPNLDVYLYELQTAQLVEKLNSGQIDCGLLALCQESQNFIEVNMFHERMLLAVPHDHKWAQLDSLALSMLQGEEMLMLDDGHCLRNHTLEYCLSVGARENKHLYATSLESLRNMVGAGLGIAFIPQFAAEPTKNVRYLPFNAPEPFRSIGMVYRPGSPLRLRYERLASEISALMSESLNAPR